MTIFVFGNEFLEGDAFAHDVARELKKAGHPIKACRSPDELLESREHLTILDVVRGIDSPMLITDVNQLATRKLVSLHDFDVGYFLALMQEVGWGKDIKIIGIPQEGDAKAIAQEVEQWIDKKD